MADESLDATLNEPSEAEKRIKGLSEKVRLTSEERDEKERLLKEQSDKTVSAEKKASFYKDFSKLSSKYQGASEHLDEIEAKVMAGYDPEDATVSVLNKAGKLSQSQVKPEVENPAGGSADTTISQPSEKTIATMTQAERRKALMENEADIVSILSPRLGQ